MDSQEQTALSFKDWVRLAEERKLVVTMAQVDEWKVGEAKKLVPLEYTRFTLHAYPQNMPVITGAIYDAKTFFQTQASSFTRNGQIHTILVGDSKTYETWEAPSIGGEWTGAFVGGSRVKGGMHRADDGSACTGSGDGWSRFMLWDKLDEMPRLYWEGAPAPLSAEALAERVGVPVAE